MSSWNYVVMAHKPTNITHSCIGNFTSPLELNLIIAKCTLIKIHLLNPQGLQDCTSRILIGAGEYCDGIYIIRGVTKVRPCKVEVKNKSEVWHRRLGHPSYQIVGSVPKFQFNVSGTSDLPCDICLRAKQTRDVFPISDK